MQDHGGVRFLSAERLAVFFKQRLVRRGMWEPI